MPRSIPASEYNPGPDSDLFETSLLGSLPTTADRARALKRINPDLTAYAIAKMLDVAQSQVEAALKAQG